MSKRREWDDAESPQTQASPAIRRAPEEWRVLLDTRISHYACARVAHGWFEHEHHEGVPIQLTEAAYREALVGGMKMPPEPSPNATSPHVGRGR